LSTLMVSMPGMLRKALRRPSSLS